MKPETRNPKAEGRTRVSRAMLLDFRASAFGFRICALVFLALLTGCAVGPDYKRPDATTIPAAYTGATNVVATDAETTNGWKIAEPQAQIPKGNWWEIFGDAELNDLENQASA